MQTRSALGEYVTLKVATKVTGLSFWTLDRAIRRGKLPAIKIGQVRFVQLDDVYAIAR